MALSVHNSNGCKRCTLRNTSVVFRVIRKGCELNRPAVNKVNVIPPLSLNFSRTKLLNKMYNNIIISRALRPNKNILHAPVRITYNFTVYLVHGFILLRYHTRYTCSSGGKVYIIYFIFVRWKYFTELF